MQIQNDPTSCNWKACWVIHQTFIEHLLCSQYYAIDLVNKISFVKVQLQKYNKNELFFPSTPYSVKMNTLFISWDLIISIGFWVLELDSFLCPIIFLWAEYHNSPKVSMLLQWDTFSIKNLKWYWIKHDTRQSYKAQDY